MVPTAWPLDLLHTRTKVLYSTGMTTTELLTTEQLRDQLEKTWLKHIKLCQDNFLYFVVNVWPDFIYRKTKYKK